MAAAERGSADHDFKRTDVVIIGAGIGGMCVAIDLVRRNRCRDFVILERSSGVGGVWNQNRYPGCGVDIESILYSYSFEQNSSWSRQFPEQGEILAYLTSVAQKYDLYRHIRFSSTAEEASWDEGSKTWRISVRAAGEASPTPSYVLTSSFLVSATGQLSQPKYPDLPGFGDFSGKVMHSATWDQSVDVAGQSVAVIGTGCSAVQIVPEIAKSARHVTVLQRTPHWVLPRGDFPIPRTTQLLYRYIPYLQRFWRRRQMDSNEQGRAGQAFDGDADNQALKHMSVDMMREQLPDRPDLWAKLTPSFPLGCKRIVVSDYWFSALGRPNVCLDTRRIQRIAEHGVVTVADDGAEAGGEEVGPFDIIVCATGFRAQEFFYPLKITGADGRTLEETWRDGAQGYLGVCVDNMPNFAAVLGPNTALLHNSFILMIEAASRYISGMVRPVLDAKRQGRAISLCIKPERTRAFNAEVQQRLQGFAVADSGCHNWYKTETGRISNLWPGLVKEYQERLEWVDFEHDFAFAGGDDGVALRPKRHKVGRVVEEGGWMERTLTASNLARFVGVAAVCGGVLLRTKYSAAGT